MDNLDYLYDEARTRIFHLLSEREMSQKEFADKLKVSSQTITDWKKGKSNSFTRNLEGIANVLDTTPGWLLFGKGEKNWTKEQRDEFVRQEKQRFEALEAFHKQEHEEMLEAYYLFLERLFALKGITKSDFYEISQGRNPSTEKVQFISQIFEITPEQLFETWKGGLASPPENPEFDKDALSRYLDMKREKESIPIVEGAPLSPPGYDLLSPEDRALVDSMTQRLILEKNQKDTSSPSNGAGGETA